MAIEGVLVAADGSPPPSGRPRPGGRVLRRVLLAVAGVLALVLVVVLTRPAADVPTPLPEEGLAVRADVDLPYLIPDSERAVLELDVWAPSQFVRDRPVVVLYPPRRALVGRGRSAVSAVAADLASRGTVVVVPEPPGLVLGDGGGVLFGEVLAGLTGDAVCAAHYAVSVAEQYGGDPDSLVLVGLEEGALAAGSVAFRELDAGPDCVAPATSIDPRHVVLHQGFWLLDPGFDLSLRASAAAYDQLAVWSALDGSAPRSVTLLLDSTSWEPRRVNAELRRPPRYVAAAERHHRIYEDGRVTVRESNQVMLDALNNAGHDVELHEFAGDWRRYGDATAEAVATSVYAGMS